MSGFEKPEEREVERPRNLDRRELTGRREAQPQAADASRR